MANCPNCKKNIGCSCKLRTSKTGKKGCTSCINSIDKPLSYTTKKTNSKNKILKVTATQKK